MHFDLVYIVFRFYKYFKDYNFYLSTSKKRYDQNNLFEFVINEKKVKDFIIYSYKIYNFQLIIFAIPFFGKI